MDDGGNRETIRETVNDLLPLSAVRKVEEESEAATNARFAKERLDTIFDFLRFLVVSGAAFTLVLLISRFLMDIYRDADEGGRRMVVSSLAALLTGALGVFIGRNSK